jgi:biopolymer transport protein ExbB
MEETAATFSLMELFRLGGVFMWPLLIFSIVTVAIAVERLIFLTYSNLKIDDLKSVVDTFVKQGKFEEAVHYLDGVSKRRFGARILRALVANAHLRDYQLAEKAAETEAGECIGLLENGFNYLTALGSLSPLTGFLGTVSGMIGAFRSISEAADVNA